MPKPKIISNKAVDADPTGYYGIRADQNLKGLHPFPPQTRIDFSLDMKKKEGSGEMAARKIFNLVEYGRPRIPC